MKVIADVCPFGLFLSGAQVIDHDRLLEIAYDVVLYLTEPEVVR